MSTAKEVREARARVKELRAVIAAGEAAQKAAAARGAPAVQRKARLTASHAKVNLLTTAAAQEQRHVTLHVGPTRHETLAAISLGGYYRRETVKPALLSKNMLSGDEKVHLNGSGQDYTLRGMLRRTVIVTDAQMKPIIAARKKVARAEAALHKAVAEQRAITEATYEAGQKPDPQKIADTLAPRLGLSDEKVATLTEPEKAAVTMAHDAQREVADAEFHLFWLTSSPDEWAKRYSQTPGMPNEKPDACPCWTDRHARDKAQERADRERRLDALPTKMVDCAIEGHGRHRFAVGRGTVRLTDVIRAAIVMEQPAIEPLLPKSESRYGYLEDARPEVPMGYCRKGKEPVTVILTADWLAELQKAAKEKAKADAAAAKAAAKAAPRRIPRSAAVEVHAGDIVEFTCPIDATENTSEVEADDTGELYVGCDDCENGFALARLANVRKVQAAA